jgi:hypothetical protein
LIEAFAALMRCAASRLAATPVAGLSPLALPRSIDERRFASSDDSASG